MDGALPPYCLFTINGHTPAFSSDPYNFFSTTTNAIACNVDIYSMCHETSDTLIPQGNTSSEFQNLQSLHANWVLNDILPYAFSRTQNSNSTEPMPFDIEALDFNL